MNAGQSIQLYLDDPGAGNYAAGHRRWVLNPWATTMGNGLTSSADALYVFGPTSDGNADPAWVAWPTAGWFPSPLQPRGRWSLSSGRAAPTSRTRGSSSSAGAPALGCGGSRRRRGTASRPWSSRSGASGRPARTPSSCAGSGRRPEHAPVPGAAVPVPEPDRARNM